MSEDKLYMETGELPPQGIGPEKSVNRKRRVFKYEPNQVMDLLSNGIGRSVVSGNVVYSDQRMVGCITSYRDDGYYRFGEWRYPKLWKLLDLLEDMDTVTVDFTVHFAGACSDDDRVAILELLKKYPRVDCADITPAMDEQEGVGDED